ncbi:MAG: AraC family transcriptional regulator [Bryobacterales bacterium]|nr:AraC family transcriptional regulator [Bryobacterales bacterium]
MAGSGRPGPAIRRTIEVMRWDEDALFQQFLLRDPSFNGKFLTGVLTTGIYCLPSCPARRPKRENVRFFRSPAEALNSGLRPCRRCRPDYFYRGVEWHENLFEETAMRVRSNPAAFFDISALARAAGVSRTALNTLFRDHAHESPAAFLRSVRVEHVCRLLQEGAKPGDAAASAGFESSSSFHEQFIARTGLTPGTYAALPGSSSFVLRLPAAYRFRTVLDFYGRDTESVSESVLESSLRKCFMLEGRPVVVNIRFTGGTAVCDSDSLDGYGVHRAAVRMLGLDSDGAGFERQFGADEMLGSIIARQRGLRIPLTPDPWEALAWAIIGQQISLRFAVTLRRELIRTASEQHSSGLRAHPSPAAVGALTVDALRALKFSGSKAEYLLTAARAVASGELKLDTLRQLSASHAARLLGALRGVGPWTVQYAFLRGLGFGDCLLAGDAGLAQGLHRMTGHRPNEEQIRELMVRYAPHRSLATYHIWTSLKGVPHAD